MENKRYRFNILRSKLSFTYLAKKRLSSQLRHLFKFFSIVWTKIGATKFQNCPKQLSSVEEQTEKYSSMQAAFLRKWDCHLLIKHLAWENYLILDSSLDS